MRITSWVLVVLLATGYPAIGVGMAAGPTGPDAGLSVQSQPVGASVYVDGLLQGATPLDVTRLTPGDHRVSVVKDGYLENSRVVSLRAGQSHDVQVKLTPQGAQPTGEGPLRDQGQAPQTEEKKGGGATKWVLLGLGVAGAGAATYLLVTKNDPPVPGTITASPQAGMAGYTSFTFTSNATDPDNDALTYDWNFGDGGTGSGKSATHVFASPGSFSVSVSVKDQKHTVTAPGVSVTVVRTMAGPWTGGKECGFGADLALNLSQSGNGLGGNWIFSGTLQGGIALNGSIETLGYPTGVSFTTPSFTVSNQPGSFTVRFNGTVDGSGNTMSGTMTTTSTALQPPSLSCSASFRR